MGFKDLKAKLLAEEVGYPVNDETIQEWINMPKEEKVALISEAKEKGGVWRESLLEIDNKAKEVISEVSVDAAKSRQDAIDAGKKAAAMEKEGKSLKIAAQGTGQDYNPNPSKLGDSSGEKVAKVKKFLTDPETAAVAPAALAAGLGAVALAKKIRASKKAGK